MDKRRWTLEEIYRECFLDDLEGLPKREPVEIHVPKITVTEEIGGHKVKKVKRDYTEFFNHSEDIKVLGAKVIYD